ncbi:hypothetical protein BGZ94_002557, partial [Podila epigama]
MFRFSRIQLTTALAPRQHATTWNRCSMVQEPLWRSLKKCDIHSSAHRFYTARESAPENNENNTTTTTAGAGQTELDAINKDPPSEEEIQAAAYDFPWLYNGSSHMTRIPHYPYAKAPKIWALLGFVPQSIQYMICKSACERMLRNNTSPEYFPDQFLQG